MARATKNIGAAKKLNGKKKMEESSSQQPEKADKELASDEIDEAANSEEEEVSQNGDVSADEGDGEDSAAEEDASSGDDDGEDDSEDDSDDFEDQGSSSDEEDGDTADGDESEEEDETARLAQAEIQRRRKLNFEREKMLQSMKKDGSLDKAKMLHVDDLSSDDEAPHNTIGNVPLRWYDEYDHIGYDVSGKKIVKKAQTGGDTIDAVIAARDDPNFRRTVYDAYNDREVVLSNRDLEIIRRIQSGSFAHPEFDAHPEYVDYYTSKVEQHPLSNAPEPKRRFLPSKWEAMRIAKIAKAIEEGRIKLDKDQDKKPEVYMLWKADDEPDMRRGPVHIPAPKMALPGHAESYNPPEEYLLTEEEQKAWEEMDPEDRELNFIPRKFKSFREVCGYEGFVKERFERCLDLYLCPRSMKRKLNIDPESLVPQLPKPRDLRPFPTTLGIIYSGHTGRVRSISVCPDGQYLVSGSDDQTVRIWEIDTGRLLQTWHVDAVVHQVAWNPNPDHQVVAVAAGSRVLLLATGTGSGDQTDVTNALLGGLGDHEAEEASGENGETSQEEKSVRWATLGQKNAIKKESHGAAVWWASRPGSGARLELVHAAEVKMVTWHRKGDYLASCSPSSSSMGVYIHQISKRKTQIPFRKNYGQVQSVSFHPSKPFFFLVTQRNVRIYNLVKQALTKKLNSGAKWISSLAVHPSGDHLIVGSYDRRVCWFDLDLSSLPFKTLKYHEKAVRSVAYHPHYPLMASASDDGTVHIFHAMVYSDLLKNPLIVPLKILRGHDVTGGVGVMCVAFHPTQPWVISGGADGSIRLFQNIH